MDSRATISILFILSASAGIVFNGFILLVLLWQRPRSHTPSHLLLLHLAILDTLFCFAVITFTSLSYSLTKGTSTTSPLGDSSVDVSSSLVDFNLNVNVTTLLKVQQFTWVTLLGTLMWTLTGLSCDRYTAICFPFTYSQLVSRKKVLALIATSWISSLVLSTIPIVFKSTANSCIQSIETLYPTSVTTSHVNAFIHGKPGSDLCFPFSLDPTFLVLSLPLSSSASPELSFAVHHQRLHNINRPAQPPPPPPPPPLPQAASHQTHSSLHVQSTAASEASSSSLSALFSSSSSLPLISSSVWPNVAKSNVTNVDSKQLASTLTAGKRCFHS